MSTKKRFLEQRAAKERAGDASDPTATPAVLTVDATLQGMQTTLTSMDTTLTALKGGYPGLEISAGRLSGTTHVHKFGENGAIGTAYEPITDSGTYVMLQPAGAVTLRVKAGGNAGDTAAGAGAREVTLVGLDETGAEVTEAVATAGASASSATSATFIRLYRAYVSSSGAYADGHTTFSQTAAITIEDSGSAADWAILGAAAGQTTIAAYTVPLGKTAFVTGIVLNVDSAKAVSFKFMQRRDILDAAAPYEAWRMILQMPGLTGSENIEPVTPSGPYPALTDLVMFGKVGTGSGSASVDFEIILETA